MPILGPRFVSYGQGKPADQNKSALPFFSRSLTNVYSGLSLTHWPVAAVHDRGSALIERQDNDVTLYNPCHFARPATPLPARRDACAPVK